MNLEKEFVPYELALRMKLLGYDRPCFGYYNVSKYIGIGTFKLKECNSSTIDSYGNKILLTPTYSQAFRFFREKYKPEELNFYIHLLNTNSTPKNYLPCYTIRRGVNVIEVETSDTYEEAELACIEKLLEIVEQKQKSNG